MLNWAIVVGINEYPALANQHVLQGAVADACDFADWALAVDGGNVAPERMFFWTHPWPAAPTGRLKDYLERSPPKWYNVEVGWAEPNQARAPHALEITHTIESTGRCADALALENGDLATRRVYVFLAGHGIRAKTSDRNEETCFVAGDFRPVNGNLTPGLVPCDSFRRALLTRRFGEVIFFTDCCRTETARTALTAQQVSDYNGQPNLPHTIAYAAQDNMQAHETLRAPFRGAFSSALMQGLRNHRLGPTHDLYAGSLKQYLLDSIKAFTDSGQRPNMWFNPDGDGPLIVRGPPAAGSPVATSRVIDVSALSAGVQLELRGGNNQPLPDVAPLVVSGATLQTPPLPPGLYSVEVADGTGRYAMFKQPGVEIIRVG